MAAKGQNNNFRNPGDQLFQDLYRRVGITRQAFTSLGNTSCFLTLYLNDNLRLPRYNYNFAQHLIGRCAEIRWQAPLLRELAQTDNLKQITANEVKQYYENIARGAAVYDGQLYLASARIGRIGLTEFTVREQSVYVPELSEDKRVKYYPLATQDSDGRIGGLVTSIAIAFPGGITPDGVEESLSPTARTLFDASQSWIMV